MIKLNYSINRVTLEEPFKCKYAKSAMETEAYNSKHDQAFSISS